MNRFFEYKKQKKIYLSCFVLLLLILLIWGGCKIFNGDNFGQSLDVEKILNESVLKDKKFKAQVQEIRIGALRAYVLEEHSNPIISMSFSFAKAGTAHMPAGKEGVSGATAAMMTAGAGNYNENQFRDMLAVNGITMQFNAFQDNFYGLLAAPKQNMAIAARLLNAALSMPHLDEDYLQVVKQQMATDLNIRKEHPYYVLDDKFNEFVFAGHPYARSSIGKKEDILALTSADLQRFMSEKLAQDNLMVGIAGDITIAEAEVLLKQIFGNLPEQAKVEALPEIPFAATGREQNIEYDMPTVKTNFAAQGTYRNSVDFYPLFVANYIFGESGLNSRLSKNIREKEGLTYGVYTYLSIYDASALIQGYFSSTPENFPKALEMLKKEWLKMGQNGVSVQELNAAKNSLIASFNLRFVAMDEISDMLLVMMRYNMGVDFLNKRNEYIEKLTLEEVNDAARKYFRTIPDFLYIGAEKLEDEK